jgi:hypothetical protein
LQADHVELARRFPNFYSAMVCGEPAWIARDEKIWMLPSPDRSRLPPIKAEWSHLPCFMLERFRGGADTRSILLLYFGDPAAFLPFRELQQVQASILEMQIDCMHPSFAPQIDCMHPSFAPGFALLALHFLFKEYAPPLVLPRYFEVYEHKDVINWPDSCRVSVLRINIFRAFANLYDYILEGLEKAGPPAPRPALDPPISDRDRFIFEQEQNLVPRKDTVAAIKARTGWPNIGESRIRAIGKEVAKKLGVSPPPPRKGGRPPKKGEPSAR